MRSTLVRRALQTAVVGGVVASTKLAGILPAHAAVLPAGTHAVTATGSDTTQNFMQNYLQGRTTSNDGTGASPYTVQTYNIPASPDGGRLHGRPGRSPAPTSTRPPPATPARSTGCRPAPAAAAPRGEAAPAQVGP